MSNLIQTETRAWSYKTQIKGVLPDGRTIGNMTRYSNTTSKHQCKVRAMSCDIVRNDVPRGTDNLEQWYLTQREAKSDAPKKIDGLHVEGRRWFQKSYGNTYHSVRIHANGSLLWSSGKLYGHGDHYLQTAVEYLVREGYLTKEDNLHASSLTIREVLGGTYSVSDVSREKDL